MANTNKGNLFTRLTRLFRSGPVVKKRVLKRLDRKTSSAFEQFRKNQSQVYSAAMSAYGTYDRMARYSDFSEMEYTPEIGSALDIYAEESVSADENGKSLHIFSDNSKIPQDWWTIFQDENLNIVMNDFLKNNYDLKIAFLSLKSSQSLSIVNKSSILPDLSFNLGDRIGQTNNKGTQFESIGMPTIDTIPHPSIPDSTIYAISGFDKLKVTSISEKHELSLSSQWEIDLWGKISSLWKRSGDRSAS